MKLDVMAKHFAVAVADSSVVPAIRKPATNRPDCPVAARCPEIESLSLRVFKLKGLKVRL